LPLLLEKVAFEHSAKMPKTLRNPAVAVDDVVWLAAIVPGSYSAEAAFIMAALNAGVPLREVQLAARHADPRTPPSMTTVARTSIATRPMSWPPSSPAGDSRPLSGG
jgi:hypothetical protein